MKSFTPYLALPGFLTFLLASGTGSHAESPAPTSAERFQDAPETRAPEQLYAPEILGVPEPKHVDVKWSAYYVTPLTQVSKGNGTTITFTGEGGSETPFSVTPESYRRAEMESLAMAVDASGEKRFGYRVRKGLWKELPAGCKGMGNRTNPLVPLVHVSADQDLYPYGSMVYVPQAAGIDLGNGNRMTGYFWVADSGGAVDGQHFDLFVGEKTDFQAFVDAVKEPMQPVQIYPLPSVEKAWNPETAAGLARILTANGVLAEEDADTPDARRKALIAFQKQWVLIPPAEYGYPEAATTLWYLTQAALSAAQAEKTATAKVGEDR